MTTNIKKKIERLAKDERGNTIIMFGLTIVPAVMLVGGAIDFGTAYKTKSKIQTAADAAVLGAVALGSTATPAQREATATSIFTANASGTGATPSVVVSSDGATVCQRRSDCAAAFRRESAARMQAKRPPISGAFLLVAFYS